MDEKKIIGDPRMEYFIDILARLQERGRDIAATPVTLRTVQDVLAVADEITAEELLDTAPVASREPDDESKRTFDLLNKHNIPSERLGRIQVIVEANEAVYFHAFLYETANGPATTWDEYMNRANSRAVLGRFGEAFEDYEMAETLAECPEDLDMVSHNKANLLRKIEQN